MRRPQDGTGRPRRGQGLQRLLIRLKHHPLARIGPGLITGVADDDPSGIATYSQAGAQFGLNMLWTMPLAFPLMAAVQAMCARIGRVTGQGLAANIKASFPPFVLYSVVLLLLVANTLNIAADLAAMGEAAELVTGFGRHGLTVVFVLGTLLLQVLVPYHRYVVLLKWLTLSLLAYAAVLVTVHVPWAEVARRTVWPQFALDAEAATMVVAVLGTTISPYLFFWQASEEVEDMLRQPGTQPLARDGQDAARELRRIRWDTWSGMAYSNLTAFFVILATAVTLHAAGLQGYRDGGPGGQRAAAAGGRFRLRAVRARHHRRWLDRRAGAGRLGRLCAGRDDGLALGAGTPGGRCARLLRRHRGQRAGGAGHPVPADQPDEGAVLERGDQRRGGGAADGGDHPAGVAAIGHGRAYREPADGGARLDRHGADGGGGGADAAAGLGSPG